MRLRLVELAWHQWFSKLSTHPVLPVAAAVALTAFALWALLASEAKLIHSPQVPLVFSPK